METLIEKLGTKNLVDGNEIILEKTKTLTITVSIGSFEEMFGDALKSENIYQALCDADKNSDGTEKGYTKYFDEWKNKGILTEV